MYLDRKFGLRLSLSEITLLFDLSLYLDRTLAQRKAKSKVKVTHWLVSYFHNRNVCTYNGGWLGFGYFAVANRWVGLGWIKKSGPMAISADTTSQDADKL